MWHKFASTLQIIALVCITVGLFSVFTVAPQKAEAARLWSSGCELQGDTGGNATNLLEFSRNGTNAGSTVININTKRSGNSSCEAVRATNGWGTFIHDFSISAVTTDVYIRFYVYFTTMPGGNDVDIMDLYDDNALDYEGALLIDTDGTLEWRNDSEANVGNGTAVITTGTWYRIEVNYDAGDAVEVKVDGVVDMTVGVHNGDGVTEVNLGLCAKIDSPFFCGGDGFDTGDVLFDDIAVNDTSGTMQTGYPGAGSIVHMQPDSAGDANGCSSGTFADVDEVTPDNSTTICVLDADSGGDVLDVNVESPSAAGIDSFDAVTLVQVGIREAATGATSESWNLRIKSASGGTVTSGTATTHNDTTYRTNGDTDTAQIYTLTAYTDPTTELAWKPTGTNSLDNMQIGANALDGNPNINVSTLWALVEYVDSAASLLKPPNNLGLVGYWSFDEGTSTRATDFSGNGNHGTLGAGSAAPTWVSGKRGKALNFDGSNDDVTILDSSSLDIATSDVTVVAWIKLNNISATTQITTKIQGGGGPGYEMRINSSGTLDCFIRDGTNNADCTNDGYAIDDAAWHHVVVVFDRDGSAIRYVDGTPNGSATSISAVSGSVTNAINLTIGQDGGDGRVFNGAIDDVRIYSRALSAGEIAKLYGSGAVKLNASSATLQNGSTLANGLVGLWTFDGGDTHWTSGTTGTTDDRSGQGNTGTLTNMNQQTTPTAGHLGQALSFDGSGDYVRIGPPSITISSAYALSAWIQTSVSPNEQQIITVDDALTDRVFQFRVDNPTGGVELLRFDSSDTLIETVTCSGVDVTEGAWHHVVAVFTADTGTTLYIDGVERGSSSNTTTNNDIGQSEPILIGARRTPNPTNFWNGKIDDVRIYNRALSATEIKQLYKLGKTTIVP